MTASRGPDERVVIPRWRPWRLSESQRELRSLRLGAGAIDQVTTGEDGEAELSTRLKEYEQWHGIHYAADVVATAVVLGLETTPGVREAATELLEATSSSAQALARRVLHGLQRPTELESPYLPDRETLQPWIAKQKFILREQPRNVLAWTDLALAYTVLGQADAADSAIRVSLAEANGNRFVLRAAARFYIYRENYAKAHDVLADDTARLRSDPWLLAAEIAIADSSETPQRHATYARRLLDGKYAPHDVSELASALATVDLKHGKVKQARRLLLQALVDPTDNSLAQAEWSVRRGIDIVDAGLLDMPRTYEARARYHYRNGQFEEALKCGQLWLADQPFALDPALFTSFVAATLLDDQDAAISACEIGLRTSRQHPSLLNNLAFSLASSGRLQEARTVLQQPMVGAAVRDTATINATRGLIEYRAGNVDAGQLLYRSAVETLLKEKENVAAASAALFWVYEEVLFGGNYLADAIELAVSTERRIGPNVDLALPRGRLERLAGRQAGPRVIPVIRALRLPGAR
jgi:tetratricopeptide (TPR) repeat protein